jgi:gas vesicle protein
MRDEDKYYEDRERRKGGGFFFGLLVGGLTGAAMGLLMAPRSGPETRALLVDKSIEIRDQVEESARSARDQAVTVADDLRSKAETLVDSTRSKAEAALDSTRAKVVRKTSQLGHTVEAAKDAARETWVSEEKTPAEAEY